MPTKRICTVMAMAFVLAFMFSTAGFAMEVAEDQMVVPDLLFGKPLGLVALGMGALTYVVTLPVTLPLGWQKRTAESLVKRPYRWTFQRGLGEDLTKP